ncbi:hypothetical protein C2845_PM08G12960 [Panicum miliaceum]|uniref:MATH domain-containing protein n=1 Tax=Panicum miliaceum TaxID=4540 RepID=A0A3L6QW91_PANMI|nr:hypothetical protein C2845_PM08G12960 [Panicum miliaceum]
MDDAVLFDDLGPSKARPASVYDDMFDSYFNRTAEAPEPSPKASSSPSTPPPVFDKPVFDDDPDKADPFDAIPLFGGGGGRGGEDFLGSVGRTAKPERRDPDAVGLDEDFIPGLGGSTRSTEPVREVDQDHDGAVFGDDLVPGLGGSMKTAPQMETETMGFDDGVIPGFGGGMNHHDLAREDPITRQESEPISSSKMSVSMPEDPFIILGDHLDNIGMPAKSGNTKVDTPGNTSGMFQTSDIFAEFPKAMPSFSSISENKSDTTQRGSVDNINSMSHSNQMPQEKPVQLASTEAPDNILPEMNIPEASFIHEVPSTTGFETLNPFAGEDELLEENQSSKMPHDVWLTVSDIALVTQPTNAPPPSHPPPPLATRKSPTESVTSETYVHHRNQGYHHSVGSAKVSKTSQIDELEDFFMAKPLKFANDRPQVLKHEEKEQYSSAATASFMDWSEMEHSTAVNQGPFDSMFTSSQYQQPELDKKAEFCAHEKETTDEERLDNERVQREREKEQRRAEREREEELEREREKVRQREQEERKRCEQEREARQAVEKAVREARERAAAEARMQAEKEARQRAERAAVQKATAEARERAAVQARERVAKAAAEAKEREAAENPFDIQPQGTAGSGVVRRTSSSSSSPFTQPSPSNLMDDLSSIFGVPSSSAVFQEMDGESEERRKGRLDRHQRIMERAAKALAEKNERDLQAQREQEERHRIGESLDFEVLWPECGWRPVPLTDLITAAAVKKEYRKATLCIHPDKVQQKGANLQQKYIAEKVFDLLKEAKPEFVISLHHPPPPMASSATPDRMSLTAVATREIVFDVEGYAATKLMAGGRGYFQSDKFAVGGYEWAVRYYPESGGVYVSVTLVLLSALKDDAGQEVGVRFACTLQDRHGELSSERWRSASYVFSFRGQEKGFWSYATHDVLEDPDFIVGDRFALACTVSVLRKPVLLRA